jgi:glycosyltransferase involved in cell wall biosynthesis
MHDIAPDFFVPRASVVIPAFNSAWSISDTLRAVLGQSLTDIEVIVVNDGSTDDLHATVHATAAGDNRVRILDQSNQGLAAARNSGLRAARGALVGFLDADDLWHPHFLEELAAGLDAHPTAPFAYAYSLRIDNANRLIPSAPWPRPPRHDFTGLLIVNSVGNGSAALFRRAALMSAGGFDESFTGLGLHGAEDWQLCLTLSRKTAAVLVPRYLVAYRLVPSSMSQADPARQLRAILAVMSRLKRDYPDISLRNFAHARTMMIGWLLPAFLRRRQLGSVMSLICRAYLLNPLWFSSRDLRALHLMKARTWTNRIRASFWAQKRSSRLADYKDGQMRPFAFLETAAAQTEATQR